MGYTSNPSQTVKQHVYEGPGRVTSGISAGKEMSVYRTSYHEPSQFLPYTPDEVVRRKSFSTFYDMARDPQVSACSAMKRTLVIGTGWSIRMPVVKDFESRTEEMDYALGMKARDHVQENLEKLYEVTFTRAMHRVMTAFDFGYSDTEKIWEPRDNKLWLKTLKTRPPETFIFEVDKGGNILPDGIIQYQGSQEVRLPKKKFIHYAYNSDFGNPYGKGDFNTQYRAWWSKGNLIKYLNIYMERQGIPMAVGWYPKTATPEDRKALKEILDTIQAKTSIRLPEGFKVEFLESSRRGQVAFIDTIKEKDIAIARAKLLPPTMFTEAAGSFATAREQGSFVILFYDSIRREFADLMNEQLIYEMVYYNFGPMKWYPYLEFDALTETEKRNNVKAIGEAVKNGLVTWTPKDENHVRPLMGMDEIDEEEIEKNKKPINADVPRETLDDDKDEDEPEDLDRQPGGNPDDDDADKEKKFCSCGHTKTFANGNQKKSKRERLNEKMLQEQIKKQDTIQAKQLSDSFAIIANATNKKVSNILNKVDYDSQESMEKGFENAALFETPNTAQLKVKMRALMTENYSAGANRANKMLNVLPIEPKKVKTFSVLGSPAVGLKSIDSEALNVAKAEISTIRETTVNIMNRAIKKGGGVGQAKAELKEFFDKFDISFQKSGSTVSVNQGSELQRMVRTNFNNAFQRGNREFYEQPAMDNLVRGYQYSSVVDDDTTEFCRANDGKFYTVEAVDNGNITPSNHEHCRADMVPYVVGETIDERTGKTIVWRDRPLADATRGKGFN